MKQKKNVVPSDTRRLISALREPLTQAFQSMTPSMAHADCAALANRVVTEAKGDLHKAHDVLRLTLLSLETAVLSQKGVEHG